MHRRLRRTLFALFALTFLIAAPAIILTTAGYRYDFVKGRLERTGVIFVSSEPTGASVAVNGEFRDTNTPIRVKGLLPGTYHVRVEKEGYHPWERTLEVRSRETTFMNNIGLFLRGIPSMTVEARAETVAFSPDRRYAALVVREPPLLEVRLVDLKNGEAHLPFRSEASESDRLDLRWAPSSDRLLVVRQGEAERDFYVWDAERPLETTNLASIPPARYEAAFWSEEGRFVHAARQGRLYRVDPRSRTALDIGPWASEAQVGNASVHGLFRDAGETLFVRRAIGDDDFTVLGTLPHGLYRRLDGPTGRVAYLDRGQGRIVIPDLFSKAGALTWVELRGTDAEWDRAGARLLYWNDLELRAYDANTNADRLITRLGNEIVDAEWVSNDDAIAFTDGKNAFVSEPDIGFGRDTLTVARFTGLERLVTSPDGRHAWFLGTIGERAGLWTLRLR